MTVRLKVACRLALKTVAIPDVEAAVVEELAGGVGSQRSFFSDLEMALEGETIAIAPGKGSVHPAQVKAKNLNKALTKMFKKYPPPVKK